MTEELERLRTLVKLTAPLLRQVRLEDTLQITADAVLELCPGESSLVRILDTSRTKVLLGARSGDAVADDSMPLELEEGMLRWVVKHKKPARVSSVKEDSRLEKATEKDPTLRSLMEVPLLCGGQGFGSIALTSSKTGAFSESDELVVVLLSRCAASVIAGARQERLNITDPHTLAYNQRYLLPRLKEEISRSVRHGHALSLLTMDLDEFRKVNDVHGRRAGDVVLQRFTDRIRGLVRLSDVLIRTSGEEFALIATHTSLEDATAFAERLRDQLSNSPILKDSKGISISQSVSIGVAAFKSSETAEELHSRSEAAMIAAKKKGGDRVSVSGFEGEKKTEASAIDDEI